MLLKPWKASSKDLIFHQRLDWGYLASDPANCCRVSAVHWLQGNISPRRLSSPIPISLSSVALHCTMGQLFSSIRGKFQRVGNGWRETQLRKIADEAFDRIRTDSHDDRLTFQDLYIAVLYAYNDINKFLPGPHNDPPSKEKLKAMMEEYDINLDGLLDREEFAELMRKLTADTVMSVGQNILIGLVLVPTVALLAKRATEGVPVVGKVAQRTPNFVYASIVALGVVLVQKPNC
ncbi:EF hand family protein [Musa troglodytarum]|uniref:EF hand family protein n=2 Tax=Musa troglodytarum TaxID=320322 RepID=A0A9E7GRY2_9LILI|nr:EF hand family protein [Musa troglodytarum]